MKYLLIISFLSQYSFCQQKEFIPINFTEFSYSPSNSENLKRITSDLDNDNIIDYVTVIHNKTYEDLRMNKKYLLIHLSKSNKNTLIDFEDFNAVYFLQPKLKNKTLEFQMYQEGTGVYGHNLKLRYNSKHNEIELIGYDYSYRVPGGHCNKTYNLLTGKFIVINDYYDMKTNKTKIEKFYGVQKQKRKYFVSDFTTELFSNLSQIGSIYER